MNIILFGPPGSGKGTQGKLLSEKFSLYYLSSGELFRNLSDLPKEIDEIMQKGDLLPDDFVMDQLKKHFEAKNLYDNILFDSTPRSVGQYIEMRNWLENHGFTMDLALYLDVSREETIKRLALRHRGDDGPEVIKERLLEYDAITAPLREMLDQDGILVTVNGERSIEEIFSDLVKIVEKKQHA